MRGRAAVACAVAVCVGRAAAQQSTMPAFRSAVETVAIYATAVDRHGRPVLGLAREDFRVYDNGRLKDIAAFSNAPQPATIEMVIDRSGSTAHQADQIRSAARAFVDDLLPDDRVGLATLAWSCLSPTSDTRALTQRLDRGLPNDPGSPIWDAIDRAMSSLDAERGRRAVLILTDGQEEDTTVPWPPMMPREGCTPADELAAPTSGQVIAHARQEGLLVYAILVPTRTADDSTLRQIVTESGGAATRLAPADDLAPAFRAVADELHHQYLLGFTPDAFDGRVHTIDVKVTRPGVTVRARRNYVASHTAGAEDEADAIAFDARPPWPAVTDREVAAAIQGSLVAPMASCTAAAVFDDPRETRASVIVRVEGPLGRIARVAARARADHRPFDRTQVSADLRASDAVITATLDSPDGTTAPITDVRVRGRGANGLVLAPLAGVAPSSIAADPEPGGFRAVFSMTDVQALPDAIVRVDAISAAGRRTCQLVPADVRAIR